jgi:hypothetical protein
MSQLSSKSIALDVNELMKAVVWDLQAGHPVCIRGRTGIGKSHIVYKIGELLSLKVVERRLSQMTEGDMLGLPSVNSETNTTSFNPPDWFKMACDEPCLLFFDERDRAVPEVAQAVMQIVDSFAMSGYKLHKDTRIISAINGGSHSTVHNYNTNIGDAAENDRWVSYDFDPSVPAWLEYATTQGIFGEIVGFISENPSFLEFIGTMEPGVVYPSRRSWFRLDQKLKVCGLIDLFRNKEISAATLINNCASYVGLNAAQAFASYCEKAVKISADHILNGKLQNLWKNLSPTEVLSILTELSAKSFLKFDVLNENYEACENKENSWAANIAKFAGILDGELFTDFTEKVEACETDNEKEVRLYEILDSHPVRVTVSTSDGKSSTEVMTITERIVHVLAQK